jgi:hypothetical protein
MSKQSMPIGYKIFFGALLTYIAWQFIRPKSKKESISQGQRTASENESQESQQTNQGGYSGGGYYGGGYASGGSQIIQMTPALKPQVVSVDPVIIPSMPRINPFTNTSNISTPTRISAQESVKTPTTYSVPPRINPYETKVTVKTPTLTNTLKNQLFQSNINQNLGS